MQQILKDSIMPCTHVELYKKIVIFIISMGINIEKIFISYALSIIYGFGVF